MSRDYALAPPHTELYRSRLTASPVSAILEGMDGSPARGRIAGTVNARALAADVRSHVTELERAAIDGSRCQLVLSLFPGVDLLGRGFEDRGFSVVRGPDLIFGGDVRRFHAPSGRFDGVIAGSPCPDFSRARRAAPTGQGIEMLDHFRRIVEEVYPVWWLLENVPGCPDVRIECYGHQRIDIDARDLGCPQRRLRHFQFGHRHGMALWLPRPSSRSSIVDVASTCLASHPGSARDFGRFCELQGLPPDFDLPGFTLGAKYRAVGNAVHLDVARYIAGAVLSPVASSGFRQCACGCARPVSGKARSAGPACRKRIQRRSCEIPRAGRTRGVTV
jgi:DNA (cytosine-5)-methyltransferase 1